MLYTGLWLVKGSAFCVEIEHITPGMSARAMDTRSGTTFQAFPRGWLKEEAPWNM